MLTIFKYPIPIQDQFTLDLPEGFKILDVQVQYGEPVLWALVDKRAPRRATRFALRGTGHDCSGLGAAEHVGTFQGRHVSGALVYHVFYVGLT